MSAFDKFQKATRPNKASSEGSTRTVALRVSGYEEVAGRHFVLGTDMETGESVKAYLRDLPADQAAKLRKPRPEIKDFVAKKGEIEQMLNAIADSALRRQVASGVKNKTEPGGVIILDGVFFDEKAGALSSRWANSASKYDGAALVLPNAMARVNPLRSKERDGKTTHTMTVTLLDVEAATLVGSQGELAAQLGEALQHPNGAGAMVRISDGSSVATVEVRRGFKKLENGEFVQRTAEEVVNYFLGTDRGKAAAECADDDGVKVEIIPTITMAIGSATKAAKLQNGVEALQNTDRAYRLADGKNGFAETVVVYYPNTGEAGGMHVFSQVSPVCSHGPFLPPEALTTKNIAGVDSPLVKTTHPAEAAAVAEGAVAEPEVVQVNLDDYEVAEPGVQAVPPAARPAARPRTGLGLGR